MLKDHHRKKIRHGIVHILIALFGFVFVLLLLKAHQETVYQYEQERSYLVP